MRANQVITELVSLIMYKPINPGTENEKSPLG